MKPSPTMLASIPFKYAQDVKAGNIVTGIYIKLAVDRFFSWIETAEADGFYLDHDAGMNIINFFPKLLNHTKGKLAGQPFNLMPFQQFCLYNVFGWKNAKGLRRIKKVYDKRAKKNGKTAEMAGLALYVMALDNEMEAEIYIGATKQEQAKICWKQARQFIESPVANPILSKIGFNCKQSEIIYTPTASVLKALGADRNTEDGINAHLSIIDEYHAHPTDGTKENLESSSVQRAQPLMYQITTAGTNVASPCKQYEDVSKDILKGLKKDNETWIMIHDLDPGDDWENQGNWIKANPLLGQGLDIDNIITEYTSAKNQISKVPNFKTKHLNMWVDAPRIWIPAEIWAANKTTLNDLDFYKKFKKLGCVGGTDLSSTTDLTADAYITYPDKDGKRYLKVFTYCPLDTINQRSKADKVPYRQWADEAHLIPTPGNTVDYQYLLDNKKKKQGQLNVKNNEFDEWNAQMLMNDLQAAGFPVTLFSQGIRNISWPTKEFQKLIYEGKIIHDGSPVLAWALASCVIYEDPNENIKVHKGQSQAAGRRVDPIIASIMALGGTLTPADPAAASQYNTAEDAYI